MSRHPRSCLLSCLLYCLVLLPCLVCSSLLLLRTHARTHAHSSFLTSPHTHTPHSSLPPRARAGAEWEGVVLIPFINEQRLLAAARSVPPGVLSPEERARNAPGDIVVFTHSGAGGGGGHSVRAASARAARGGERAEKQAVASWPTRWAAHRAPPHARQPSVACMHTRIHAHARTHSHSLTRALPAPQMAPRGKRLTLLPPCQLSTHRCCIPTRWRSPSARRRRCQPASGGLCPRCGAALGVWAAVWCVGGPLTPPTPTPPPSSHTPLPAPRPSLPRAPRRVPPARPASPHCARWPPQQSCAARASPCLATHLRRSRSSWCSRRASSLSLTAACPVVPFPVPPHHRPPLGPPRRPSAPPRHLQPPPYVTTHPPLAHCRTWHLSWGGRCCARSRWRRRCWGSAAGCGGPTSQRQW